MYKEIDSVEDLIKQSGNEPVVVLKHSATCPISAQGKRETEAFMQEAGRNVYLVIVQQQRDISNQLEQQLGIRHQSPQLIVIKNGKGIALNHYNIRRDNIKTLL